MASKKLSGLTTTTSTADGSLIYVADTTDSGSSYTSKHITKANLLSGLATETYVASQISDLIGSAPDALNTLQELGDALNDDASFATSVTNLINANETHIDNAATLSGVAKDSTNLGAFSGSTIADSQTVKAALQALETAVEAAGSAASLSAVVTDASDLQTLTGIADGNSDLGAFSGSTIADNDSIKDALQSLETAVETKAATGANVNTLVGSTTAQTVPTSGGADNYLFLVVDKSDGSLKVIDKNFMELEG